MHFRSILLGTALLLLLPRHASAGEPLPSAVTLDGSLPWQYSSNPGRSSGPRNPDHTLSPYVKLSAFGTFWKELHYQFYGSAGLDRHLQFMEGNGSVAALGGHIGKRWEHVNLAATYERGLYYDEYFRQPESIANDFGAQVRIFYANREDGFAAKPMFSAAMRTDDSGVLKRTMLSAKLGLEKELTDRWTALLTPYLRHYEYQDAQKGRRDTIFSIAGGARYEIASNMSWTTSVGYEVRESTVAARNYVNYVVGTSIDFSFDLLGRGGSNRFSLKDTLVMPWDKR